MGFQYRIGFVIKCLCEYNFTVNDFIVGPRLKYGARAIGYISKADKDDITEDEGNPNSDAPILPNKT